MATATLARPVGAVRAPAAESLLPAPPPLGALRGALVAATAGAALQAVAVSRQLVTSFGGAVKTLGTSNTYFDDAAALCGWLLFLVALLLATRAASGPRGRRSARLGLAVAAIGTVLFSAAAACALWTDALKAQLASGSLGWLANATGGTPADHEVQTLVRTGHWLVAAGWLALGVAAVLGRPSRASVVGTAVRRALAVLAGGLILVALGAGAAAALVSPSQTLGQRDLLVCYAPPVLGWLLVAAAVGLLAVPLRRTPATRGLAVAVPAASLGAVALAAAAATVLAYAQRQLDGTAGSWFVTLSKLGAATGWLGWLLATLAFGIAAVRLVATATIAVETASPA
jgi:hypothetical protein